MMLRKWIVVAAIAFCIGFGQTAHAQNKNGNTPVFGHVNLGQIAQSISESKTGQRDQQEMRSFLGSLERVFQQLTVGGAQFLTEAEIKELASLYEKPNATDGDKKRITALEDQAIVKSQRKTQLENEKSPTADQKKQLTDLLNAEQAGAATLKQINDDFRRRLEQRQNELNNKTLVEIKAIIAKIAQEKGLAVVFNEVAIWTPNDITQDVIKQLNK